MGTRRSTVTARTGVALKEALSLVEARKINYTLLWEKCTLPEISENLSVKVAETLKLLAKHANNDKVDTFDLGAKILECIIYLSVAYFKVTTPVIEAVGEKLKMEGDGSAKK